MGFELQIFKDNEFEADYLEWLVEEQSSQTHPSATLLQNTAKLQIGPHVQSYTPVSGFFAPCIWAIFRPNTGFSVR